MSMMMYDRDGQPRPNDILKTVIASAALQDDAANDNALYLERDSVLDDELLESSLDDYDDLLAAARDDAWDE